MGKWYIRRLEDIIDVNPPVKLSKGKAYAFIDIDKVSPESRTVNNAEMKIYTGQSCSKFCSGDTVFSRITPCLENRKIAKVRITGDAGFGSTEFFVFRAKKGLAEENFVYYLTSSDAVVLPAINSMTGASGRQRADRRFVQRLKLKLPDLPTQQRIADILSTYDDLIENNNRRVTLLEQAAQELYKEWFVRFRFPGYENTKFENGLPTGWVIRRLESFGEIETGKTPSMSISENYGNDFLFIKTPDMHGNVFVIETEEMLSTRGNDSQPKKLIPANSIMVTCIGTGGIVAINAESAHTNQQINSIIPYNNTDVEWLFFTCKALKPTIELFGATGTTMTNLSKGKFSKLKVLDPGDNLRELYHTASFPMLKLIKTLMYQNRDLIHQRDLLLPRLMNGHWEV